MVNSSWDEAAQEIVVKGYVNLGIAAATPRGLVVPNIKDAGRMSLAELAGALAELTATARDGKTLARGHVRRHDHDHQRRACSASTPARRSSTRGSRRSWPSAPSARCRGCTRARSGSRQVTQLALSFDHRIIDGELGSRFLADVGAMLHDPGAALAF